MLKENTDKTDPRLCIDCIYCRTKNQKYFCLFENFYKNLFADILLLTPEDFDCENFEDDE